MFPRIYLIGGILVFLLASFVGTYFYAHNKGYQEKALEDVKALQTAKERESKALEEVSKLSQKREVVYRDRIKTLVRFRDDSGCLDNPFDDSLYNLMLDGYRSL